MNQCECGCGETPNKGKRYVWGHNARLQQRKGKYIPCDTCGTIIYRKRCFLRDFEKHYCSAACCNEGIRLHNQATCEYCGKTFERTKYRLAEHNAHYCSPECDKKARRKGWKVPCWNCGKLVYRKKAVIERYDLFVCSSECKRAFTQSSGFVQKILLASAVKPNGQERELLSILKSISLNWHFVGDGKIVIDGKIPDFWNRSFHLVELYGDYWHEGDDPSERIEYLEQRGFRAMVIWGSELAEPDKVKRKIINWIA